METNKAKLYFIIAIYAMILIFAYIVGRKILSKIGIIKTDAEIKTDTELSNPLSAWNPGFWKSSPSGSYLIKENEAQAMIKNIHDSFTLFQDDFNSVCAQFQKIKYKSQLSYLADKFQQKYNESLLSFLQDGGGILWWDGLSDNHMNIILNYTENLK